MPLVGDIMLRKVEQLAGLHVCAARQVIEPRLVEQIGAQRNAGRAGIERERTDLRTRARGCSETAASMPDWTASFCCSSDASGRTRARRRVRRR